jgi:aminopeptidase N
MENAGAIFYADQLFTGEGPSETLIAHETAHQWFGDAVTEREWPHVWLSESFATYFAALYTEHAAGDSAFRAELEGMRRAILDAKVVAERPVIDSTQTDLLALLNANSYQKGGFVLHMLRREVGDSAFFRGVRAYWSPRVHGNARTDDLRAVMEREVGRDLSWFFDQWLRRPGFVEPTVRYSYDSARRQVKLIVEQGTRFAPYRFPLTVEFTMDDGSRRSARVNVPAQVMSEITLRETFERAPTALRADPRVDLLAGIRTP